MPTIQISPEQAKALARGEDIIVSPPKPEIRWNASFIPDAPPHGRELGEQRWHDNDVMAPKNDPEAAARAFFHSSIHLDAVRGGLIAVCPRDKYPVDGPYMFHTGSTRYFRCDSRGVRAGVA